MLLFGAGLKLSVGAVRLVLNAIGPVLRVALVRPVVGVLELHVLRAGQAAVELGEVDGATSLVLLLLLSGLLALLLLRGTVVSLFSSLKLGVLL